MKAIASATVLVTEPSVETSPLSLAIASALSLTAPSSNAVTSDLVAKSSNFTPESLTVPSAPTVTTSPSTAPVNFSNKPLISVSGISTEKSATASSAGDSALNNFKVLVISSNLAVLNAFASAVLI